MSEAAHNLKIRDFFSFFLPFLLRFNETKADCQEKLSSKDRGCLFRENNGGSSYPSFASQRFNLRTRNHSLGDLWGAKRREMRKKKIGDEASFFKNF